MGNTDSALKKAIEWIASEMKANSKADRLALRRPGLDDATGPAQPYATGGT